jgi:hypothetical protein
MTLPTTATQSAPKMSQMASIRNGEIPVILVYVKDQVPQNYKMVPPEEAERVLALIEFMQDYLRLPQEAQGKDKNPEKGVAADEQK